MHVTRNETEVMFVFSMRGFYTKQVMRIQEWQDLQRTDPQSWPTMLNNLVRTARTRLVRLSERKENGSF